MSLTTSFQMEWEGIEEDATYDYEDSSSDSVSSSSGRTSRTFGSAPASHKSRPEQVTRESYDSTFSASLASSNHSSQLSSPVLRRNDSQRSGFYDIDYDSDSSSSSDFEDEEYDCPSQAALKATIAGYLGTTDTIRTPDDLQKAILSIFALSEEQKSLPQSSSERDSKNESQCTDSLPLTAETQILTTLINHPSCSRNLCQLCERHLLIKASNHGSIMSSETTESHFDIWLPNQNGHLNFGWQIHCPMYRMLAVRDSLQDHLKEGGRNLEECISQNVFSAIRKKEVFLGEVLKLPLEVLEGVDSVKLMLRPVEGG